MKSTLSLKPSVRIESIDILRGVVMILMALDHSRDYFYYGLMNGPDPTDLATTTPGLFFTRFVTHYCAPIFVFLAGTSAFLYGKKKTRNELFRFLLTRGLWLMLLEVTLNTFIWWFDISFSFIVLQVIWAIGFGMVLLSFCIYIPYRFLLVMGIVIVAGHNLLDDISMDGTGPAALLWYNFFQVKYLSFESGRAVLFAYGVIPWLGVMILGYCFGALYKPGVTSKFRRKRLLLLGSLALILFIVLRTFNLYGDPAPWSTQNETLYTFLSVLNVSKYPPSLLFTLITLGPACLALYGLEKVKSRLTDWMLVFGRVPLFYYFLHVFVIHIVAMIILEIAGGSWHYLILTPEAFSSGNMERYGVSLVSTYALWLFVIVLLYPVCRWYMRFKKARRGVWWISYL